MNPSKRKVTVLKQICNLIPRKRVQKIAKEHSVEKQFIICSPWSHVVALFSVPCRSIAFSISNTNEWTFSFSSVSGLKYSLLDIKV